MQGIPKNASVLLTKHNNVITFLPRSPRLSLVAGGACICIGVLIFLLLRAGILGVDEAWQTAGTWIAVAIASLGILGILKASRDSFSTKVAFDCYRQTMTRGRKTYPFSEIGGFRVGSVLLLNRPVFVLIGSVAGKEIQLIEGFNGPALIEAADYLNQQIVHGRAPQAEGSSQTAVRPLSLGASAGGAAKFRGIVLSVLGAGLSVFGLVFFPDVILTKRGFDHGPLLWPLGIWLALLGLGDVLRLRLAQFLLQTTPPTWKRVLLAAAFVSPYLIICWR